jgi:hypothetical protein
MKLGKLNAQHCTRLQQRLNDCCDHGMIDYELMNAIPELDRADDANLKPKIAERSAKVVLNVVNLPL